MRNRKYTKSRQSW